MQNYVSDPNVRRLAKDIYEGQCIVFIGSGVSIPAGLPSWNELTKLMKDEAELKDDYGPSRTADVCKEYLGERGFYSFLEKKIKKNYSPTRLHKRLAKMPFKIFVTTNYDTLMEDAIIEGQGKENLEVFSNNNKAKWSSIIDTHETRWILKIHGCVTQFPDNIIIGEQDYLSFADENKHVIDAFTTILKKRSVLFLGYSLSDWNVTQVLFNTLKNTLGYSTNKYFVGINSEKLLVTYFSRKFNLRYINICVDNAAEIENEILNLLTQISDQYEMPGYLVEIFKSFNIDLKSLNITRDARLDSILAGFDVTILIRLVIKIREELKKNVPLKKIIEKEITINDLIKTIEQS